MEKDRRGKRGRGDRVGRRGLRGGGVKDREGEGVGGGWERRE